MYNLQTTIGIWIINHFAGVVLKKYSMRILIFQSSINNNLSIARTNSDQPEINLPNTSCLAPPSYFVS